MKRIWQIGILLTLGLIFVVAQPSYALRCNHRVIQEGDRTIRVAEHCGEPDFVSSWQEEVLIGGTFSSKKSKKPDRRFQKHIARRITIDFEQWTYNFGPTRLIRYLTFRNGILIDIETGSRGY